MIFKAFFNYIVLSFLDSSDSVHTFIAMGLRKETYLRVYDK